MKQRHLRKEIEYALSIITMLLIMFVAMINDFDLKAIPIILFAISVIAINVYILNRWGKGRIYE